MATQLRSYRIEPGHLDDFVTAWRAGVYPLRIRFGFTIEGAWAIEEADLFVWVVSYDGPDDWDGAERAYYDSDERNAMNPDPAQWIAEPEGWFVQRVV